MPPSPIPMPHSFSLLSAPSSSGEPASVPSGGTLQYFVDMFNWDIVDSLPCGDRLPYIEGNWYNGWDLLLRIVFWGSVTKKCRPRIFPQRPIEIPLDDDSDSDDEEELDCRQGDQSDYATDGDYDDSEDPIEDEHEGEDEDDHEYEDEDEDEDGNEYGDEDVIEAGDIGDREGVVARDDATDRFTLGAPFSRSSTLNESGSWPQDSGDDGMTEGGPVRRRKRSDSPQAERLVRRRTAVTSTVSTDEPFFGVALDVPSTFKSSGAQSATASEGQRADNPKTVKTTCRIPDFVGELKGPDMLFLIVENKGLPEKDTKSKIVDKFAEALDQSKEQAEFGFTSDERIKLLAAILAVGDFWTYLEYHRDKLVPLPRDANDYHPANEAPLSLDKTKPLEAGNKHDFLKPFFGKERWIRRCDDAGVSPQTRGALTAIVEHLKEVHKDIWN